MKALLVALSVVLAAMPVAAAGLPGVYGAMVVQPVGLPERAEFDLTPAIERARREHKRLYVYLAAHDCRFCRRYEAFLEQHADELLPHFRRDYVIADLRSSLALLGRQVYIRLGATSRSYTDFQTAIGDERARLLVYPNIWILDAEGRPLMQMPTGAGTFETVPEQIEVLQLLQ